MKHQLDNAQRILAATLGVALALPLSVFAEEDTIPFTVGKLFFQLNDTDGDLGFHAKIDGDAWKRLEIENPRDQQLLRIDLRGRLRRQGLTELSFESAEPNFEELSPEVFFRRFPEGTYEIEGRTLPGEELESEVEITHVLPAPPTDLQVNGQATPVDCDEDPGPLVAQPVVLTWDPVTTSHPNLGRTGAVEPTRYEVAVERELPTELTMQIELPADVTELELADGFVDQGESFKFQVLVTDIGGNETSSESCFQVGG